MQRSCYGSAGYTLIEIMVVIAILAAILTIGAPRMFNTATQMRTGVREMAVMTRELRNVARLTGSTMRIVIDMKNEKEHLYWVESASGSVTILSKEQEEELQKMTSAQREEQAGKNEFEMDSRVLKKQQRLPRGLFFESVEYSSRDKPLNGGVAYVHFFSQGLAEDAVIHLTDRKTLNWTIAINPLTGRADVFERKLTLKELRTP